MKKIFITAVLITLCISFTGCKKNDDTEVTEFTGVNENVKANEDEADETDSEALDQDDNAEGMSEESSELTILNGLIVSFADGRKNRLPDYKEVDIANGSNSTGILFIATEEIAQFDMYELQVVDVGADGKPVFDRVNIYGPEYNLFETPIVFNVEFSGDMSAYGFVYDCNGVEKSYSIMLSGEDGSLVIEELNAGYPDDNVTIPFTNEFAYNPQAFPVLISNQAMSDDDIDNAVEGIGDMVSVYLTDSTLIYESIDGIGISQDFYLDDYYGTRVTCAIVSTGNELLDSVMQKVGYKNYEVDYYYPFGMWIQDEGSEVKPVYVSLLIDGNSYEYYFLDDELFRRVGPEGVSNYTKPNDFINGIYSVGCYYGNTLVGEKNRYNVTISSIDEIAKTNDSIVLSGMIYGRNMSGSFVIDEKTEFDKDFDSTQLEGLKSGESFYDWYLRAYDSIENEDDWIEFSALLGIWDFKTTNGHVDSVCGTYWWD